MRQDVDLYIETNLKGPHPRPGKSGYLLKTETAKGDVTLNAFQRFEISTENESCLVALEEGLKRIKTACKLNVYTDCVYLYNVLRTGRLKGWEERDWLTAKKQPVKHAAYWQDIQSLLVCHEYEVTYKTPYKYQAWMQREVQK